MKMKDVLAQMKRMIDVRHQCLINNAEIRMARLRIIITVLLTLYLPWMAYVAVERVQNYDRRISDESLRAETANNMDVVLASQQYIIESIDVLRQKNGIAETTESKEILRKIDTHQAKNKKEKVVDAGTSGERYNAANIVGVLLLATGLLKLSSILAESYNKLTYNWVFYGALMSFISGVFVAVYSVHQLAATVR